MATPWLTVVDKMINTCYIKYIYGVPGLLVSIKAVGRSSRTYQLRRSVNNVAREPDTVVVLRPGWNCTPTTFKEHQTPSKRLKELQRGSKAFKGVQRDSKGFKGPETVQRGREGEIRKIERFLGCCTIATDLGCCTIATVSLKVLHNYNTFEAYYMLWTVWQPRHNILCKKRLIISMV